MNASRSDWARNRASIVAAPIPLYPPGGIRDIDVGADLIVEHQTTTYQGGRPVAKIPPKNPKRQPARRSSQLEYELHLVSGFNTTDDRIEAELTSAAIDPVMHPKGTV